MRWRIILGLILASSGIAVATEEPAELTELTAKYTEARKRIEFPLSNLERDYALELKRLKAEAQSAGDLNQILLIDRIATAKTNDDLEIPARYRSLNGVRQRFLRATSLSRKAIEPDLKKLETAYSKPLFILQQELTKQGRIIDALTVKAQIEGTNKPVQKPVTGDLIGHWKFDTDGTDFSGYERHASIHGNANIVEGRIGEGALLVGAGQFAEISHHTDFDFQDECTVSCWINRTPNAFQEQYGRILTKADHTWRIQLGPDTNGVVFHFNSTLGQKTLNSDIEAIKEGRWHHVAGVFDGETATLYVDGRVEKSVEVDQRYFFRTNESAVRIGGTTSGNNRVFNGMIDDVRFYRIALSRSNIVRLASGLGLPDIDPN